MGSSTYGKQVARWGCLVVGLGAALTQACSSAALSSSSDGGLAADTSGGIAAGSTTGSGGAEGMGGGELGGAAGSVSTVPARVGRPAAELVPKDQLTAGMFDDNLSFTFFTHYTEALRTDAEWQPIPIGWGEYVAAHEAWQEARTLPTQLDVSLVIDTTGSMGDELDYLKDEFSSLSSDLAVAYPQANQRWSLVVYRDLGDDYVTRPFDFTEDRTAFLHSLRAQDFDGGGDFPEAPDAAIATANSLSWRADDETARLLFLVADAPHHDDKAEAMAAAILQAQQLDIHIYPVASSGIDELTEHTFRSAAQLTGGRYIFLTDDSGIGGEHKDPTLPCYYVTTLKQAILRSVEVELTGETPAPTPAETVRFAGDLNEEGNCFFGDGFEARPF